jgi:hypothetical protein
MFRVCVVMGGDVAYSGTVVVMLVGGCVIRSCWSVNSDCGCVGVWGPLCLYFSLVGSGGDVI